jgi:hypothetical protein
MVAPQIRGHGHDRGIRWRPEVGRNGSCRRAADSRHRPRCAGVEPTYLGVPTWQRRVRRSDELRPFAHRCREHHLHREPPTVELSELVAGAGWEVKPPAQDVDPSQIPACVPGNRQADSVSSDARCRTRNRSPCTGERGWARGFEPATSRVRSSRGGSGRHAKRPANPSLSVSVQS